MGFSSDDRAIIETALAIRSFDAALNQIAHHGTWSSRLMASRESLTAILDEIDEYLSTLEDCDE